MRIFGAGLIAIAAVAATFAVIRNRVEPQPRSSNTRPGTTFTVPSTDLLAAIRLAGW